MSWCGYYHCTPSGTASHLSTVSSVVMEQHPPVLIDTLEKLDDALDYWKNTTFSQHYLKLGDVVESLRMPRQGPHLVDARQEYAARWLVSHITSSANLCSPCCTY